MNSKLDVVVTFYKKEDSWPLVSQGLANNADKINKVLVMHDDVGPLLLAAPEGVEVEIHNLTEKRGWGAAERCNTGAALVTTPYFLHIDGDMMLASHSVAKSLLMAEPQMLLACQIHDTTRDAELVMRRDGHKVVASRINPERRPGHWRKPQPLNLRHGHYLAHTESFLKIGGHDLTPPWDTEYHSIDYCLAAAWMLEFGRESFEFGGGAAFHIGGIYEHPVDEAESPENKARVQAVLQRYRDKFTDEGDDGSFNG